MREPGHSPSSDPGDGAKTDVGVGGADVRATVRAWVRGGEAQRAFQELLHFSRSRPLDGRTAALLVSTSERAGTVAAADAILEGGVAETEGAVRRAVRRQRIRLLRRTGSRPAATEELILLLAEHRDDVQARRQLAHLLTLEGRWAELDASLEREARDAIARGRPRRARRALLERARLWEGPLERGGADDLRARAAQLVPEAEDAPEPSSSPASSSPSSLEPPVQRPTPMGAGGDAPRASAPGRRSLGPPTEPALPAVEDAKATYEASDRLGRRVARASGTPEGRRTTIELPSVPGPEETLGAVPAAARAVGASWDGASSDGEASSAEAPGLEAPAVEASAPESPAVEAPATKTPTTGTPGVEPSDPEPSDPEAPMVEPAPLQPLGELRRRARHVEAESIGETREETGEETAPPLRPSPVEVTPLLRGRGPGAGAAATERRRTALFEQVRSDPLSADGYADLAVFFAELGDTQRAHLMEELAEALEGRPSREPPPPTLLLGAVDRAGLRHPSLRNEVGALLGDLGPALCRWLGRAEEPEAGPKLHAGAGPGAPAAVASLRAASRVLGIAAPDTAVVADAPLPLALSCAGGAPRLLVSRALFSEAQSASVLRFHAARALYGLCPDLLPLCCLKGGELSRGLTAAGALLSGDDDERDARALGVELTGAARLSAQAAWQRLRRSLEPALLKESAQISLDRAGLVACGSVGIALAAVRELGAAPRRITDLVRFAASERHLRYREPRAEASASSRPQ